MKTKLLNLIFFFSLIVLNNSVYAQAPDYKWAINAKGKGDDRGNKITTDPEGNIIVTGRYHSKELLFDNIKLVNSDQDSSTSDIFIVKYSPEAKVLWAKSFGGFGDDFGLHSATDKNGNIVLVGSYDTEQLILGTFKFANKTDKGDGGDIFIAKFDSNGEIIWAKSAGGNKGDGGYPTCVIDKDENIFVTGSYSGKSFQIDSVVLNNSDRGDETFISKFSSGGKLLWVKSAHGLLNDMTQSSVLDIQGNLVIAGYFTGANIIFDSLTLYNSGVKSSDIFVAKYSSHGKLFWAKSFGGPSNDVATCGVDMNGNIFLAGMFSDSTLTLGNSTLRNNGKSDILVLKLDIDGKMIWAKSAGGNSVDAARNFCVDKEGNCIVTGLFKSPTIVAGSTTLTNIERETEDIFIIAYGTTGEVLWAKSAGGAGRNSGRSCACDKKGNLYLTGSFDAAILKFDSLTLSNSGDSDVFILKLSNVKQK